MDVVRLAVIAGPTGTGKSAVALRLASQRPVTIISADSRQIYRGFDIGTAKPTPEERQAVPHELLDVCDPAERYNAARWADAAVAAIATARAQGRIPLIVGGTGLYLRALFDPLFEEPELDPAARAALEQELSAWPTEQLRSEVAVSDPDRSHLGRTQLLRAIEVHRLTGTPLSRWHDVARRTARFRPSWLVMGGASAQPRRLEDRLREMLVRGWLDEVRALDAHLSPDAAAWNATGYGAMREVVRGTRTLADACEDVLISTRQYAKRQRTWFRHQLSAADPVVRIERDDPGSAAAIEAWWAGVQS